MVILLASYPRSGNTFFRIVAHKVFGYQSYSITKQGDGTLQQFGISGLAGSVSDRLPLSLEEAHARPQVYLVKTHTRPAGVFPTINIVRDGRDCLVSFAHYIERFEPKTRLGSFEKTLKRLITEAVGRSWCSHVMYWQPRATVTVPFEMLIVAPISVVQQALRSCGVDTVRPDLERPPEFKQLHEISPEFFRRGESGAWREEFPPDLMPLFWQHQGKGMEALGYV